MAAVLAALSSIGCQSVFAECGIASTYSSGSVTANGERYNHNGISAAHKTLPFGTRVVVTDRRTGRSILVRINDRGPFVRGRIIDLSTGAQRALGMGGLAPVCIHVASYGSGARLYKAVYHPRYGYRAHHRHYVRVHYSPRYTQGGSRRYAHNWGRYES